jgi:FkbM family methyltransferase
MNVSEILKEIYQVEWIGLNILECGANIMGEETKNFESKNNCWYIEANESDYNLLKLHRKNTLNLALSDRNGKITFNVCSHVGNSSCEYSSHHLDELKKYGSSFKEIEVNCIKYDTLLEELGLVFDLFVMDVEGHEKKILYSWKKMNIEILPSILVIECGYDWKDRLSILKELGYKIDCYYFNNCYLTKLNTNIKINQKAVDNYNNKWKQFIWNDKIIYTNELIK